MTPAQRKTPPAKQPRTNADRTAATRAALIAAGQELFGEQGYAKVSIGAIVEKAGVTRGALYHHFDDKSDLFRAVFEQAEADVIPRVLELVGPTEDPWLIATKGSKAFLDICLEHNFQQIALVDAPSVLGVQEQQEIADKYGGALLKSVFTQLIESGRMSPQPVDALARVLTGALVAGATEIAQASNPKKAREEVGQVVESLLLGLRAN